MRVEQIDDLPLLMSQIEALDLPSLIDTHFPAHKNWAGAKIGQVVSGWLLYLLSESDHRLSHVEEWADSKLLVLSALLDQPNLRSLDFSDDRLGRLLDRFSEDQRWKDFELSLGQSLIEVYDLAASSESGVDSPAVIRSDSFNAPQFRTPTDLFRFGHSKQRRKDQPQCKVMVSALDPHAIPLSVEVVPGNSSDYPYYLSVINRARKILGRAGCLYVGDSHMGSMENRRSLHQAGDYYLCPLNRKQCTSKLVDTYLEALPSSIEQLPGIGLRPTGQGHAFYFYQVKHVIQDDTNPWQERRILCYSLAYANRLQTLFDQRLEQAEQKISHLVESKKGRRNPKTLADLQGRITKLIAQYEVEGCFEIHTQEQIEFYQVGKYKNRPKEQRQKVHLSLEIKRVEEQIERQRRKKGWQIYATNVPESVLKTEQLVKCYRMEYRIEHLFDYIINRDMGLLPLYLKKENRVKGLIRLLSLAMRLSCSLQLKVRRALKEKKESLAGIYPGNKGRKTHAPTTPMLLRAMRGIALVVLKQHKQKQVLSNELNNIQLKIIRLAVEHDPYQNLMIKINSLANIRET